MCSHYGQRAEARFHCTVDVPVTQVSFSQLDESQFLTLIFIMLMRGEWGKKTWSCLLNGCLSVVMGKMRDAVTRVWQRVNYAARTEYVRIVAKYLGHMKFSGTHMKCIEYLTALVPFIAEN